MVKQIGETKIIGTIEDLTFYKMEGQYYARKKSSLTGKRVKRDPRFIRTMQSAHRLGKGSQLASKVYRSLPKADRVYTLFKELKSIAVQALKEGVTETEVIKLLQQRIGKVIAVNKDQHTLALPKGRQPKLVVPCMSRLFTVHGSRLKEKLQREQWPTQQSVYLQRE